MDRKKLLSLLLALLLPIYAAPALADGDANAPEALDMTSPIEAGAFQFDFLPWYSTVDDAAAAFGLNETEYRRIDISSALSTVIEFSYPSALSGGDALVRLMFEQQSGEPNLTEVEVLETFSDMDGLAAYFDALNDRFADMLERGVVSMASKPVLEKAPEVWQHIRDNDPTSSRITISNAAQFGERSAAMLIHMGAVGNYREYIDGDDPYFVSYRYCLGTAR